MKAHCEKNNKNVFDILPLTFKLECYTESHCYEQLQEIFRVLQLIERNLQSTVSFINAELLKLHSSEKKSIRSTPYKINEAEHRQKNLWLLKPTGYNRGVGIHVFNSI